MGKCPKTHKFNILGKTMGITFSINEKSFGSLSQLGLNFGFGLVLVEVAILWKRMSIVLNFKIQLFWICMRLYQATSGEKKGTIFEVLGDYHHSNPLFYEPNEASLRKGIMEYWK